MTGYDLPEDDVDTYSRSAIVVAAAVSLAVTALLAWVAAGFDVFYEGLFRVGPTVEGGGVGADWVAGNTMPALDLLIALVHAADVILGVFILFLLLLHWAAFRRLAARMRSPEEAREGVAADGGTERPEGGEPE
ncbi:hypothetical protein NGM10_09235 [Halorussus salilacus]|uniref:hypothetical protein n=1 Tax=Halorussus salilacus TaxID=2953750 RepID=UPI00209D4EC6|nr:hypothetical protein [Halorussus salilacus]USZ66914.1 hypothetical protein NGM10_09235 [Halorussus salilacus]